MPQNMMVATVEEHNKYIEVYKDLLYTNSNLIVFDIKVYLCSRNL